MTVKDLASVHSKFSAAMIVAEKVNTTKSVKEEMAVCSLHQRKKDLLISSVY